METAPIGIPFISKSSPVIPALIAFLLVVVTISVALIPVIEVYLLSSSARAPSPFSCLLLFLISIVLSVSVLPVIELLILS